MKNRSKSLGKHSVPTDEPFVDYENLVTGAKFNYDRPQATDAQINELCVNEKLSVRDKFLYLLEEGNKIQKWSIFQNFRLYALTPSHTQLLLEKITKNYPQLLDYLSIMGDGLKEFLNHLSFTLGKKSSQLLFDLTFRVITQNPAQVEDWWQVLAWLAKQPHIPTEICIEYINGSFDMNSPPDRRRVAMQMINALLESSQKIEQTAHNKVLFFNKDQNAKTRQTICIIMHKLLLKNPKDDELWKAVWEYFHDRDPSVKQKAAQILATIHYHKNFQPLLQLFTEEQESILIKKIKNLLLSYSREFEQDYKARIQVIAFCNRVFKSKNQQHTCTLLTNLTCEALKVIGVSRVQEEVNFALLQLRQREVLEQLFDFFHHTESVQFRQTLKYFIFKGLKDIKYEVNQKMGSLAKIFDLQHEEQINLYCIICNGLLERSKWHQLEQMLGVFENIKPYQSTYDKLCLMILKLLMASPSFLLGRVFECVIYLLLTNRRSLELLISIRQKILNSKFWSYRKNYILLYSALKSSTSFQYHKILPSFLYKAVLSDKSYGVKLTFLKVAPQIYKFTEPSSTTEKGNLRQAVSKLQSDKDPYVSGEAAATMEELTKIDNNSTWLAELYQRNRQLVQSQESKEQVIPDPKKTIKTQNEIKRPGLPKRRTQIETRKTMNIARSDFSKDNSLQSMSSLLMNSKILGAESKRPNLFRCHSVKMKVPTTSTKKK